MALYSPAAHLRHDNVGLRGVRHVTCKSTDGYRVSSCLQDSRDAQSIQLPGVPSTPGYRCAGVRHDRVAFTSPSASSVAGSG